MSLEENVMKEWENVEEAERSLPGRAKMWENCGRCWCGCDIGVVFFFLKILKIFYIILMN